MFRPPITLTTDFGLSDSYVGELKGVLFSLSPETPVVDISHSIPSFDVLHAAHVIRDAWKCFPEHSIHIVVVDPGVGTPRRRLLLEVGNRRQSSIFIGPDNGIFSLLCRENTLLGAWEITDTERLPKLMGFSGLSTFDGRDIFGPAAAMVANGTSPAELGREIGLLSQPLVSIAPPEPRTDQNGDIIGEITYIDSFGNAITNIPINVVGERSGQLPASIMLAAKHKKLRIEKSYEALGAEEAGAVLGSRGYLELASARGSAALKLSLFVGDELRLTFDQG